MQIVDFVTRFERDMNEMRTSELSSRALFSITSKLRKFFSVRIACWYRTDIALTKISLQYGRQYRQSRHHAETFRRTNKAERQLASQSLQPVP